MIGEELAFAGEDFGGGKEEGDEEEEASIMAEERW